MTAEVREALDTPECHEDFEWRDETDLCEFFGEPSGAPGAEEFADFREFESPDLAVPTDEPLFFELTLCFELSDFLLRDFTLSLLTLDLDELRTESSELLELSSNDAVFRLFWVPVADGLTTPEGSNPLSSAHLLSSAGPSLL